MVNYNYILTLLHTLTVRDYGESLCKATKQMATWSVGLTYICLTHKGNLSTKKGGENAN